MTNTDRRTGQRAAELLPEETTAGTENAEAMADALLSESDERQADRDAAPGKFVEHRRSEDTAV